MANSVCSPRGFCTLFTQLEFCDGWDRLKENQDLIVVPPSSLVMVELLWPPECLEINKQTKNH